MVARCFYQRGATLEDIQFMVARSFPRTRFTIAQRAGIIGILLLAASLLASCVREQPLPADARQALEEHVAGLPGAQAGYQILTSWKGRNPRGVFPAGEVAPEIWCAEVEFQFEIDIGDDSPRAIWIVTRLGEDSPWTSAMLLTMSAMWPYEACGTPDNW
jgi:hypothetical protein